MLRVLLWQQVDVNILVALPPLSILRKYSHVFNMGHMLNWSCMELIMSSSYYVLCLAEAARLLPPHVSEPTACGLLLSRCCSLAPCMNMQVLTCELPLAW